MRLIVITPSSTAENEQYILKQMLKMGLHSLHVRKPHYSTQRLKNYLDGFSKEQQKCIVIHTHHRLLYSYDLKGIHLTKVHKKKIIRTWLTEKIIRLKRNDFIKSTSCNSISAMTSNYPLFEYVMLTPVFGETTEQNPAFSGGTLGAIISKYPGKVIARGGANVDSISIANELGFSGIAFQNYLWKNPDPIGQFRNIINRFNELAIKIE